MRVPGVAQRVTLPSMSRQHPKPTTQSAKPPRGTDAFGRYLEARFHERHATMIVERDDGHVDVDGLDYLGPPACWLPHQRRALRLAKGRVLDVGCGGGRVCLALQERGLDVLGIDVSPRALRVCRQRGVKHVRQVAIEQLPRSAGMFDTVILFGNNLGLLGNAQKGRRLLRKLHAWTSPEALVLGETLDPHQTTDPAHLAYHRWNRARGRLPGQVRIRVRCGCDVTPYFNYLFVSPDELRALVAGTGWRVQRCLHSKGPMYVAVLGKLPAARRDRAPV